MFDSWCKKVETLTETSKTSQRGRDCTEDATENAWQTVQVVHTTRVVQLNFLLEEGIKVQEAKCGDNARDTTNCHRSSASDDKIGAGAYRYTTGKSGIQHYLHVEPLEHQSRNAARSDAGA